MASLLFRSVLVLGLTVLAACSAGVRTEEPGRQPVRDAQQNAAIAEYFRAARQMQGGDLAGQPEVTRYVQSVGAKLTRAAASAVPYEFAVVDTHIASARVLPGGKITVSRGLLLQLTCESQLASVLASRMAHAPPAAYAQSVSTPLSADARSELQNSGTDIEYAALVVGEAALAANLLADSSAAVTPRAAQDTGDMWLRNAGYDPAADSGCTEYQHAIGSLRQLAQAYAFDDKARRALHGGAVAEAEAHAQSALRLAPNVARFHETAGDAAFERRDWNAAITAYRQAITLSPAYFRPWLAAGMAAYEQGDDAAARDFLDHSMDLLPTAAASFRLGRLTQRSGDVEQAIQFYQLAASSDSDAGRDAARWLILLDMTRHPQRYVHVEPQTDARGQVWMLVRNDAPFTIREIVMAASIARPGGGVAQGPVEVRTGAATLAPGSTARVVTPLLSPPAPQLIQVEVEDAEAADATSGGAFRLSEIRETDHFEAPLSR